MLVRTWTDALGGRLTNGRRIAVENAAALLALSEHAKVARLSGDTSISLNDVARLENAAARAVRELDLPNGGDPERESVDSWSLK